MERPWFNHYEKGVAREIDPDKYSNIAHMLESAADRFNGREVMRCIDVTLSYEQFNKQAEHFAAFLQNNWGLKKGDRIAIMLPNLLEFPVTFFAAQKLGLVCVATNPLYTPREMQHQFKDAGCKAIVIFDHFLHNLEKIIGDTDIEHVAAVGIGDRLPLWKKVLVNAVIKATGVKQKHNLDVVSFKWALKEGAKQSFQKQDVSANDIAVLQYTGGTTGVSKGAMLTHRNIMANVAQNLEWCKNYLDGDQQTILGALPLYHIYALTVNFLSLASTGHRVILLPRPIPIKKTVAAFKKYKIHMMSGVNTIFNEMVNNEEFRKLKNLDLQCALAGGMAMQEAVANKWEDLTGVPVIEGYGLTEASPSTHCNPLQENYRIGSIGLPLPSTDAKIMKSDGTEAQHGEEGELCIRGPQVMLGYWNRPDETAKTLRDGWLWTGDIAVCDESGFFNIVDRKKDMILVSGFNVFPNEVEAVIAKHPKVREVAVIGVDDKKSGERVKAFIVANEEGLGVDEIKAYCKENLAGYKCPKTIEFRDDLPKSIVGKILRRELRDDQQNKSA